MKTYTIEQVAEILQVHDRTVRKFIKSGDLKAANIGTEQNPQWRIMEPDLMEYLESRKTRKKDK